MREATKNMLIGLFVLIALFLTVSIVLFLKPKVGDGKKILYARFSSINKIKVGTQFLLSGKPIGEVIGIEVIPYPREQPTDALGRFYFFQLAIKYDSHVDIYTTDKISIVTSGLLGEKSVSITPQAPPKGVIPRIVENQPVYADSVEDFERLFFAFNQISEKLQATLTNINNWIGENGTILSQAIHSINATMIQAEKAIFDFNDLQLLKDAKRALCELSRLTCQIETALQTMNGKNFFDNLSVAMENFKNTSFSVDQIASSIAQGQGSLGKFIQNDDYYLKLMNVTNKAGLLMDDVNNYGLLYHLNKNWQRTHHQRIEALNALETPHEFKNYVKGEVDNINKAMNQLSQVIDEAEQKGGKNCMLQDEQFKKDFADLLRQVDALFKHLKTYNQTLQGCVD